MKVGRKVVHICLAFSSISIALVFGKLYVITLIIAGLAYGIYAKFKGGRLARYLVTLYGKTGGRLTPFLYGTAVLLVYLLFDLRVAIISIMTLGVGDTVAALVGSRLARHRYPYSKKSLEGSIVGFLVNSLILLGYTSLTIALLASGIGMFIESFPWRDDNPPIAFGTSLFLTFLNL